MSNWSEGFIKANDLNIHFHRTGGAGKPPLILLHGVMDNGLCWTPVARDLQTQFDIIMPDARGHGQTGGWLENFSYTQLADDVVALIGTLGLKKPVLYGHSMGAMTAVAVAATYPDVVRALVLEDPPFTGEASPLREGNMPSPEILHAFQDILSLRTMSPEERLGAARRINPGWDEVELGPWADSKVEFDTDIFQHLQVTFPWREQLSTITCPILLVTGDPAAGAIVTPQVAREAASLWRQGEIIYIQEAGHCLHRDRYAETIPQIQNFLSRI
ncbi:MAG TPA: alpha/beta hydrolase [Ktedonobacteraceae bacterium]|nr:alpha/beta hydrolase [Ktedonobacteraceae bacterium]